MFPYRLDSDLVSLTPMPPIGLCTTEQIVVDCIEFRVDVNRGDACHTRGRGEGGEARRDLGADGRGWLLRAAGREKAVIPMNNVVLYIDATPIRAGQYAAQHHLGDHSARFAVSYSCTQ